MKFLLKNSSLFTIPGNSHMLHLGTISGGLREFVVMFCLEGDHKGKCYIEELVPNMVNFSDDVYGNFKYIEEDELAEDLARFAQEQKLTDMKVRINEAIDKKLFSSFPFSC